MAHPTSRTSSPEKLVGRLLRLEREVRAIGTTPQLAHSSVEGGALTFNNEYGETVVSVGQLPDGTNGPLVTAGPPPPPISGVSAETFPAGILARWDGTWLSPNGVAPLDFSCVEIHLGADEGFEPDLVGAESLTLVATITSARGGWHGITGLPYEEHWVRFVPRTLTGKWGDPTEAIGPVTPGRLTQSDFDSSTLAVGFVLTGAIQVGALGAVNPLTLSGTEGFVAPQPDGGEIRFPVDGSAARITAHVVAFSMHIKDNLQVSGVGSIGAALELTSTPSTPTAPATISAEWPSFQTGLGDGSTDIGANDSFQGLTGHATEANWLVTATTSQVLGRWYTGLRPLHRTSGALVTFPDPTQGKAWTTDFRSTAGVTRIGTAYFVAGLDTKRGQNYVYKINASTYEKEAEVPFGTVALPFGAARPRLCSNGTNVLLIWVDLAQPARPLRARTFTSALAVVGDTTIAPTYLGDPQLGDLYCGNAGTGSTRLYVASRLGETDGSARFIRTWNPTGWTRSAEFDFNHASGTQIIGLHYDDVQGRMVSMDNIGRIWTYSKFASNTPIGVQYTWYDGDNSPYPPGTYKGETDVSGLPSGTRESLPSPIAYHEVRARTWPVIETPPPPDEGVIDPLRVDRANRIGIYMTLWGGTMARHAYLPNTAGVATRVVRGFDSMPTGGALLPTTDGFADSVTKPGEIYSGVRRFDGKPKNYVSGSGPARLDGLLPPGAMIFWHSTVPPGVEWLRCNGSTVSRTVYADLFASVGVTYGTGDGSTTFALPPDAGLPGLHLMVKT